MKFNTFMYCINKECISASYCERFCEHPTKQQLHVLYCCGEGEVHCNRYIPNEKAKVFNMLRRLSVNNFG